MISIEPRNLDIVYILTFGFAFASIMGYLAYRVKLSPILGYLLAGYLIGPYSPGFVADIETSEQLAEIGVILMMFGVGMNFKIEDLINVKNIAVPGAFGQTLISSIAGAILIHAIGWSWGTGIIFGLAIGVASTVVLVRVLSDNRLLNTTEGHIAIGWLIVEDLITVLILILIPNFAAIIQGKEVPIQDMLGIITIALLKFAGLAALMFTFGRTIVAYVLSKVILVHSRELFTLTVLSLTFLIATGSSYIFGTSIALGAFLAGMLIGQTELRHQALAHSLALKDVFVVIFFLSVGMLFNPMLISKHLALFLGVLFIILVVKPLTAYLITIALKHPVRTAITISFALAQIGEFSFILAEEAMNFDLMPEEGFDIIVACALISISINPLIFSLFKRKLRRLPEEDLPKINKVESKIPPSEI